MVKVDTEHTATTLGSQGLLAEVFAILSVLDDSHTSIPAINLQDQPKLGTLMVFWEPSDALCQG